MSTTKKKFFTLLSSLLIIVIAGGLSSYWLNNQPRAARKPLEQTVPLVDAITPKSKDHQTTVFAFGNVMSSQSVNLNAQVEGTVISVNQRFIEGGLVKRNEEIVRLDPKDYELKLRRAKNELVRARFNLKLELGQQAIAKREFEMLGKDLEDELAAELIQRKPHLEASESALNAAEAAYEQAELELARTRTLAPFDAVITERNANIGSRVSNSATGTPLVKLASTDNFWIDVSLPIEKLRWIDIPGINSNKGATVKITMDNAWGPGVYREGIVKQLKAGVDPEGRMAKLIVEVDDPLSLKPNHKNAPTLMLDTLVRVEISGKPLKNVYELPETALHDGRYLWLINDTQTLDITDIRPIWAEQGRFFLDTDQLPPNTRVVASALPAPVKGMRIRSRDIETSILTPLD